MCQSTLIELSHGKNAKHTYIRIMLNFTARICQAARVAF